MTLSVAVPTWSVSARSGGVQSFLVDLLRALARTRPAGAALTALTSRANDDFIRSVLAEGDGVAVRQVRATSGRGGVRLVQEQCDPRLGRAVRDAGATVLLVPSNVAWRSAPVPQVVVVQAPFALRGVRRSSGLGRQVSSTRRAYYRACFDPGLHRARTLVAVSAWVGHELRVAHGVPGRDVAVIAEGFDVGEVAPVATREEDGTLRLCFLSSLYGYKGLGTVLDALGLLAAEGHSDVRLTVVGRDVVGELAGLQAREAELGLSDAVTHLGGLDRAEAMAVLAASDALVYPSELETFGIPPLEAMALGVPVIASRIPSLVETCGRAVRYVDPGSPRSLADAVVALLAARRAGTLVEEVARGRAQAASHDWDEVAGRYWRVLAAAADA